MAQAKQPNSLGLFLCGMGLAIVPPLLIFLFTRSTYDLARDSSASWYVDGWILVGTWFLLIWGKGLSVESRKVIESSLAVGALAMFAMKLYLA